MGSTYGFRDCQESWGSVRDLWPFRCRLTAPRGPSGLPRTRPPSLRISEFGGLRVEPETVEFPGSEETPDATYPETPSHPDSDQLPLSPPPRPLLGLLSSLLPPGSPSASLGRRMDEDPWDDIRQPDTRYISGVDPTGLWLSQLPLASPHLPLG